VRHEFRVIAVVSALMLLVGLSLASKSPKEDESEDNSIGVMARSARQYFSSLLPTDWDRTSVLTNIAMPALFLLFLSSVSNVGSKASAIELNQIRRKKRSPITGWSDRLQRLLDNFQIAVQKMQKFEEELENEIHDDSVETIDMTD